jgi:hypothetical protein
MQQIGARDCVYKQRCVEASTCCCHVLLSWTELQQHPPVYGDEMQYGANRNISTPAMLHLPCHNGRSKGSTLPQVCPVTC